MGGQGRALSRETPAGGKKLIGNRGSKARLFASSQTPGSSSEGKKQGHGLPTQGRDDGSALWPHFTLYLRSPLLSNVYPHPHTIPDVNLRLGLLSD